LSGKKHKFVVWSFKVLKIYTKFNKAMVNYLLDPEITNLFLILLNSWIQTILLKFERTLCLFWWVKQRSNMNILLYSKDFSNLFFVVKKTLFFSNENKFLNKTQSKTKLSNNYLQDLLYPFVFFKNNNKPIKLLIV